MFVRMFTNVACPELRAKAGDEIEVECDTMAANFVNGKFAECCDPDLKQRAADEKTCEAKKKDCPKPASKDSEGPGKLPAAEAAVASARTQIVK